MRRFSQRNSLVTLNEINITPLLDLAFVLLIIFVITTPLMKNSLNLNLPQGGSAPRRVQKDDLITAEAGKDGVYMLNGHRAGGSGTLEGLRQELKKLRDAKPKLVVSIHADRASQYQYPFQLMNLCQQMGIPIQLAADPVRNR